MTQGDPSSPHDSLEGKLQRLAPAAAESRAFLLVVEGPRAGRLHLIGDEQVTIGRYGDADIVLDDPSVSHEHAQIVRRADGYYLLDLDSSNGTLLNGVLVSEQRLRKRDRIQIGETSLVFLEEGAAEVTLTVAVPRRDGAVATTHTTALAGPRVVTTALATAEDNQILDLVRRVVSFGRFVRRNLAVLLPLPVLGLGLGVYSLSAMPPPETAGAAVRLTQARALNPVDPMGVYRGHAEPAAFFAEPEKLFANPDLVRNTLVSLGAEPSEDSVKAAYLGLRIERDASGPTGSYSVTFEQASKPPPSLSSVGFLNEYLGAYLFHEVDKSLHVLKAEAGFLESELKEAESELQVVEDELLKFRSRHIDSLPEQAGAVMAGKLDLSSRRAELEVEVERNRILLSTARTQLGETGSIVTRRVDEVKPLQQELAAKRRELATLRADGLKDDHPQVSKLALQTASLEREIESKLHSPVTELERTSDGRQQEVTRAIQQHEADLRVAQAGLSKVSEQLARAAGSAAAVPEVDATIQRLTRKQDSLQRLRAQLFEKHREKLVQINLETANVRSRYEIVSPAKLQDPVTKKFLVKRLGGGLVIGLVLAILIVVPLELRRLLRRHPELLKS